MYVIENKINGKQYIGITVNPVKRWQQHQNPRSGCIALRNSIQCHGIKNFTFEVICIGGDKYIEDLEYRAIKSYNSLVPSGYNIKAGGEGSSICYWDYGNDKLLGKFTDKEISTKLGVSSATVQNRRYHLGVKSKRAKTRDTRFNECKHLLGKVQDTFIADKYGICLQNIIEFREELSISSYKEVKNQRSREECYKLFGRFNDAEISRMTGISSSSVNTYRNEVGVDKLPPESPTNKFSISGYEEFLGKASDKHIAKLVGCSTKIIKTNRDAWGLPSFEDKLKEQDTSVIRRENMLHEAENICGTSLFTRYITPKGLFLSILSVEFAFKEIGRGLVYSQLKDTANTDWYRIYV